MASIVVIGTCDTKLQELLFLRNTILQSPHTTAILIDVGRHPVQHDAIALSSSTLLSQHAPGTDITPLTRADFIALITTCACAAISSLHAANKVHGIVSAGGSSNTSLVSAVMRRGLPLGLPKHIISTMASGDTGPIVGESDITLTYSVVDVAGLNQILRDVLTNAGVSIAAAAISYAQRRAAPISHHGSPRKRVGITMFGVTTPGVDAVRAHLASYPIETYVFHATGHGGKAMEGLISRGELDAVIDLTTTEIADHVMGGVLSAGEARLDAAVRAGIPNLVSLGALDMCNFGPRGTVPAKYSARNLYAHNPDITLLRTSPEDCRAVGDFICRKLSAATRPDLVQVWIPRGGLSAISVPGGPFEDPEADEILFGTIRNGLKSSGVDVVEDARDVNDEGFARDIAEALVAKMGLRRVNEAD